MIEMPESQIGGASVRRTFTNGGRHMRAGDRLSRDEVMAIALPNRRALADSGYIDLFPLAPNVAAPGERIVVGVGKDKCNVINSSPLTREQAEKLARE